MADKDDDAEKTHDPTPQKLEEKRKKGEVAKSADLTTAATYGGFLLTGLAIGASSLQQLGTSFMVLIDQSDALSELIFEGRGVPALNALMLTICIALLGWYVIPAGLGVLSVVAQRAFLVAPDKLKPKMSRLNPIENAKKKYGLSGLFEFAKSFAKLLLYSILLGVLLVYRFDQMAGTLHAEPHIIGAIMARMMIEFMFVVLLISVCIGGVDYLWQRHDFIRQNRMSHRDLQEEHKRSEGDPHLKQKRRQRGAEIASSQMMADVPTADVVIVNPTHYAVALKWSRTPGSAPICVAKGVDHVAHTIRDLAQEHGIPIRHDPPTARALFAGTPLGEEIDPDHYRAVASAIRFAQTMRDRARYFG
ncbi:MAG: flagellar biosynthesis protein FlhB [Roseovarius sp.]